MLSVERAVLDRRVYYVCDYTNDCANPLLSCMAAGIYPPPRLPLQCFVESPDDGFGLGRRQANVVAFDAPHALLWENGRTL